jgi:acetyltransferase
MTQHYLSPLFNPRSVAVVGAGNTAGKVGAVVFANLLQSGFKGAIYAVNPKHAEVQGHPCYARLEDLPEAVDLVAIATPATTVPDLIEAAGRRRVRAAVVMSAGFSEIGPKGRALEQAMLENAQRHGLRIIGPNCLGIMRPSSGLDLTFSIGGAMPGNLALVSQSGALCTAILDWARPNGVGFSNVISMGTAADVDFGEILDYLVSDPLTDGVLLYIESVRNARRYMSAMRMAARLKPVIVVKSGRHQASSRAAVSHSGALIGGDDVFDAALARAGVVRVDTIVQMFAAAKALARRMRASGKRLAIVTNAGGPAVMAADRAVELGVVLPELSPETLSRLDAVLPPVWSHGNPVDLIGDADAGRYRAAVSACLEDRNVDGVLAILTPQAMTQPLEAARAVIGAAENSNKPLLACWMGESQIAAAREALVAANILSFRTPEPAVEVFGFIAAHYENQKLLLQTPGPLSHAREPDTEGARLLIESALAERRGVLTEMESKALLSAFHIPVAKALVARSPNEALQIAEQLGFPVAMKIHSPDISHKTEAGGVRLNLGNAPAVRSAYNELIAAVRSSRPQARVDGVLIEPMVLKPNGRELLVGVFRDPVFGPVITFGAGGTAVEVLADRSVQLPPLNSFLVRNMVGSTRISRMLGAFRHMPPVDMAALESVLLRVSEMVCELPWLKEMDINPLIVDEAGALAADARVVLDPHPSLAGFCAHMAICPYPTHLVSRWQLSDGTDVTIRPIRPEDAEIEQEFVRGLSEEARYFRFMDALQELTPSMLVRFTQIDYDREMALLAAIGQQGREVEIGIARYVTNPDGESCEFALVVADAWQRQGIGHKLMQSLMEVARQKGLRRMQGEVLASNEKMLALVGGLGFRIRASPEDPRVRQVVKAL